MIHSYALCDIARTEYTKNQTNWRHLGLVCMHEGGVYKNRRPCRACEILQLVARVRDHGVGLGAVTVHCEPWYVKVYTYTGHVLTSSVEWMPTGVGLG